MPFLITSYYIFICDDCKKIKEYYYSVKEARQNGWAISKDYKKCYCPRHAPNHRNVGRNGVKKNKQLKIKINGV